MGRDRGGVNSGGVPGAVFPKPVPVKERSRFYGSKRFGDRGAGYFKLAKVASYVRRSDEFGRAKEKERMVPKNLGCMLAVRTRKQHSGRCRTPRKTWFAAAS